uniref:C2H2-type domain-containing protein n=1 Tax=Lotharella globosa TaxID=91324 RepID=A0A7S3YE33_9EUKA|mmetsp:Transcript_20289/g.40916  ORF Transcript_20289/g.40916 Transcript_20289/m.40916 type:complete len:391 (-) Transcript_20289:267-1439(-)
MSFVCNACNCNITSVEQRSEHYSSYWHRYNVKRSCESLPPVSKEVFEKKLSEMTKTKQSVTLQCFVCRKTLASKKSYDHHMRSKRHLQKAANRSGASTPGMSRQVSNNAQASSDKKQPLDSAEAQNPANAVVGAEGGAEEKEINSAPKVEKKAEPVPLKHCLFCGESCDTLEGTLKHMLKAHSFYVPYVQFLVSVEGFMKYLGEKVGLGRQCLYCNRCFKDLEAVRQHMRDVGHCKLSFRDEEDKEEYQDFFHVPEPGEAEGEGESEGEGEGDNKSTKPESKALVLAEPEGVASEITELGEIVMKDGRVLGHRSLARYYKQSLKPRDPKHTDLVTKMIKDYRAIGLPGYHARSKRNEKSRKDVLAANKRFMKLGFKGNKQKHFKDSTAPF